MKRSYAGINYYEYDPTIEGDRNRVINQFNDLKFMLKGDEMSGIYTPKNQFTNRLSDGLIQENLPTEEKTNLPTSNTNNDDIRMSMSNDDVLTKQYGTTLKDLQVDKSVLPYTSGSSNDIT